MSSDAIICGIEITCHPNGIDEEGQNSRPLPFHKRRVKSCKPIGWQSYGEEYHIACCNPAAEIAWVEQRRMAPCDGNGSDVKIRERKSCCHRRTGLSPMEMAVEQQSYAEGDKEECSEYSRAVIHRVMAIGIVVYQQAYCHCDVSSPHHQQRQII